jgi:predicted P-loop ATPase
MRRWASFVGSVNKSEFLTDDTGNRRFLIVEAESIQVRSRRRYETRLGTGKGYVPFRIQPLLIRDEIDRLNRHNEEYRKKTQAENLVIQYMEVPESALWSGSGIRLPRFASGSRSTSISS